MAIASTLQASNSRDVAQRSVGAVWRCTGAPRVPLIALVFAVLAVVGAPAQVPAQVPAPGFECARLQPAVGRLPAYGRVEGPARCEGFFARNVSQPFIELVSLTRGPAGAGDVAAAPLFELRADARMPLRLLVQPLRSGPFYRVDAPLVAGQSLRWDAGPMLAATGLRAADLGFLALAPSRQAQSSVLTAVAPLALSPQAHEAHEARQALAIVRVSVPVSSMAWRAYRAGAETRPPAAWTDLPNAALYAWQRTGITLDLPQDGKGLRVDVQAVAAEDGRALPLLRFAIIGPTDAVAD